MFSYELDSEISLELLEERHAQALFDLVDANRDHLRRWHPWVDETTSVEDTEAFIKSARTGYFENGCFQTAIRHERKIIGVVGFHKIDWSNRICSLGYWLASSAQGNGFITNCCRVYIQHAFSSLALNRVEIRCAENNARSRAIPDRLGFAFEGILREQEWLYTQFVNHAIYAINCDDWRAKAT